MIDAKTGNRWPIWTEIDSDATDHSKALMEIHPAVNFESGHRYIVALRNLKNAAGTKIEAPAAFRYFRDEMPSEQKQINARRAHFKSIFNTLEEGRHPPLKPLPRLGLHRRHRPEQRSAELAMRNDAFSQLGDTTSPTASSRAPRPTFTVTSSRKQTEPGQIARRVKGTFDVPCYLFPSCGPGGTMHLDAERRPDPERELDGQLRLHRPAVGDDRRRPDRRGPSLYGHGLFGSAAEVGRRPQRRLAARAQDRASARPMRSACPKRDVGNTVGGSSTTSRSSPSSPTACSRGCSTSSTWAGR